MPSQLKDLLTTLLKFRDERDWEQFHDSKNLAVALNIEASEVLELFLWSKEGDLPEGREERLEEELADVFAYLLLLANNHGIDLEEAVRKKVEKNAAKYPVEKAKGSSKKYDEL